MKVISLGLALPLASPAKAEYTVKAVPKRVNGIQTCYFWQPRSEPDSELGSLIREGQMLMVACPDECPRLIADFNRAGGIVLLHISTYKAPSSNGCLTT